MIASLAARNCQEIVLFIVLLITCMPDNSRCQIFNVSLVKSLFCTSGFLQNKDDIHIDIHINVQNLSQKLTSFSLEVEAAEDNHTFTEVCRSTITSSNCNVNIQRGCYCARATDDGQVQMVTINHIATIRDSGALYRVKVYWELQFYKEIIYLRIPNVYGEPDSYLIINDHNQALVANTRCEISTNNIPHTNKITFCTNNLNTPILTIGSNPFAVNYFLNVSCGTVHEISNPETVFNFSYGDSCRREGTFQCFQSAERSEYKSNFNMVAINLLVIIFGGLVAMMLLVHLAMSMIGGLNSIAEIDIKDQTLTLGNEPLERKNVLRELEVKYSQTSSVDSVRQTTAKSAKW